METLENISFPPIVYAPRRTVHIVDPDQPSDCGDALSYHAEYSGCSLWIQKGYENSVGLENMAYPHYIFAKFLLQSNLTDLPSEP